MQITLQWLMGGTWHEKKMDAANPITIGRLDKCHVTVADPTVSREHARIYAAGGALHVRNLSKTNPIRFLDGSVLEANQVAQLFNESSFALGKVKVRVLLVEAADQPALQIRCTSCQRVVEATLKDCPWCGASLAFAETFIQ